jgi:ferrous-iron efflux pump FieF
LTLSRIDPARARRLRTRATYAALAAATVLIAAKFAAWLGSGSVALLSSLIDSLVDAAASVVNFIAVKHAMTPADREHRFGHGKAEPLAALGQSAFLIGSALLLLAEAVQRLISPVAVENGAAVIAVMVFSTIVAVGLVAYQRYVVGITRSLAIGADEIHYRGDVVLNLAVILAIALTSWLKLPILDPLFGGAAGLWIIYRAIGIIRLSLTQLMDHELPDEERARIRGIAERQPGVSAVHDMRTRIAGPTPFIQLHLEMDGEMNLKRAHEIADGVEAELRDSYPGAEIIIHQDPAGIAEPPAFAPRAADC